MAEQEDVKTGSPRQRQQPLRHVHPEDQSLASALKVSFRVLTVIMLFLLAAFVLSGVKSVAPTERGVLMLFDHIVGTADQGLVYTWPYPVGGIELVDIKEKTLAVDDFWMHETPQDQTKDLKDRRPESDGLRPGWDGAVLTGDRNLLHVRLICKYEIADVLQWKRNVADEEQTIRSMICAAAIRAASTRTADALQRLPKAAFLNDIQQMAQAGLDAMESGIRIKAVQLPKNGITWPLKALQAFNDVLSARSEMEGLINESRGEAEQILNAAAGPSYRKLVGEPWLGSSAATEGGVPAAQSGQTEGAELEDFNLMGQYAQAVQQGQTDIANRLLERIEEVLVTSATGDAARIIAQARTASLEVKQTVMSRADRFRQLLQQLPDDPQARKLMFERLWSDVSEKILTSPTAEKYYVTPSDGGTVLIVPREQEIIRQVQQELLKSQQKESSGGK